jgi:hypothetical protein
MVEATGRVARFAFHYGRFWRTILSIFRMGPRHSWIEVRPDDLYVHMGWAFRATISRSAIQSVGPESRRAMIGVHGWKGRWLVNSSGGNLVAIELDPPQRGFFNGIRLKLRRLAVSPDDPEGLIAALS